MDKLPLEERIDALKAQVVKVLPDDTMAEAGRKAILPDLIAMLKNETGSRSGDDIEHVHDMRVATRRMRSAFRLLADYYKPKALRPYNQGLRKLARVLGAVRDLDVLIDNLQTYQSTLDDAGKTAMQGVIDRLDSERHYARKALVRYLDKGEYRRFVEDYAAFLTTEGAGSKTASEGGEIAPSQVRHILPVLIYEHLGTVRAYDSQIADADPLTLHALRIEFKRLRYLVSLFSDVLGTSIKDFITELKAIQDHLGRMNDIHVAGERLAEILPDLAEAESAALNAYIDGLRSEEENLRTQVADVWKRFNSKTVQRQLATAVASL